MTDGAQTPAPEDKRVLEDVLDEVLSFNFRSLRTLRDIILRPARVARAFLDGDRDAYTPPMRVWFGVLTWMFLLSVIWGGWGTIVQLASSDGAELNALLSRDGRDAEQLRDTISSVSALIFVPIEALLMLPGVFALKAMRPGTRFITATHCYFIPVTASALTSTLVLTASYWWHDIFAWSVPVNLGVFLLVATPMIRAGFAQSLAGTIGKTALLCATVFGLSITARVLIVMSALIWAVTRPV